MWKIIGIISALVILLIVGIGVYNFTSRTGQVVDVENGIKLPSYALQTPKIKAAYLFAVSHPEDLNGVPCGCGCMQHPHDGRIHKRGLLDCFMKEDGSFEKHGSQCDMCVNDALKIQKNKT